VGEDGTLLIKEGSWNMKGVDELVLEEYQRIDSVYSDQTQKRIFIGGNFTSFNASGTTYRAHGMVSYDSLTGKWDTFSICNSTAYGVYKQGTEYFDEILMVNVQMILWELCMHGA
jgi:hypothetical protein